MLTTLNIGAVALGVGAGGLTASIVALVLSGALTIVGLDSGAGVGLVLGIVAGLATGGWVAGWRTPHSERFHGMVTGLLLAFLVVVIARFRGSPASNAVILWQLVLSVFVSGLAGWLAGRRKAARR